MWHYIPEDRTLIKGNSGSFEHVIRIGKVKQIKNLESKKKVA
jgi:hypothetical protein